MNQSRPNESLSDPVRRATAYGLFPLYAFFLSLPIVGHEGHHHHREESQAGSQTDSGSTSLIWSLGPGLIPELLTDRVSSAQGLIERNGYTRENLRELAFALVEAVRLSQDEGHYDAVVRVLDLSEKLHGPNADTAMLRSHIFLQWHRFREAERIARQLVAARGAVEDYALLGDALLEQGEIDGAEKAYNHFGLDDRSMASQARLAQLAWAKGLESKSIRHWRRALEYASSSNPETIAWCRVQLGEVSLVKGEIDVAGLLADSVLDWKPDHAAAAFLKGRSLWWNGKPEESVHWLEIASEAEPLPIRLWWLRDVLRDLGQVDAAEKIDRRLAAGSANLDPRTGALFLAFEKLNTSRALELARSELQERSDRKTLGALGFCYLAHGDIAAAGRYLRSASAKGVVDGRLSYHLALLAIEEREQGRANDWLKDAYDRRYTLTPSETKAVESARASMGVRG